MEWRVGLYPTRTRRGLAQAMLMSEHPEDYVDMASLVRDAYT